MDGSKPVPLHPSVVKVLGIWREDSPFGKDTDFLFPSIRRNGKQPLSPDTLLKKVIRPALKRAGIEGKAIGWHSLRHSLATNLRAAGVDLKTAQELLRHANSRITLDVYTRAISATKREANNRVMEMVFEAGRKALSAPSSAPSKGAKGKTKKGADRSSTLRRSKEERVVEERRPLLVPPYDRWDGPRHFVFFGSCRRCRSILR